MGVIVNLCDAWQSYSSFALVGVYTNKNKFKSLIKLLIKENKIEMCEEMTLKKLKEKSDDFTNINYLQNNLKYVNFNEIEFNIKQI